MTPDEQIADAVPARHFARPPYRAELFNKESGWSGVMNSDGINCLTFKSKPGAVIASIDVCEAIAAEWNGQAPTS